jgi:hypothetical protein
LLSCASSPDADLSVCIRDTDEVIRTESQYAASVEATIALNQYGVLKSIQDGSYSYAEFATAMRTLHASPALRSALSTKRSDIDAFMALPVETRNAIAADAMLLAHAIDFVRDHPLVASVLLKSDK